MRVINVYTHPLIQAIKACPSIAPTLKSEVIQDVVKILMNKEYRDKVIFQSRFKPIFIWVKSDIALWKWNAVWNKLSSTDSLPVYKAGSHWLEIYR